MVAMICPGKQGTDNRLYHNQYINPTDGKWATDFDHKATCRQDKVEILEYCKKVCRKALLQFKFEKYVLLVMYICISLYTINFL